ncbi:purine-binding chemotaxis protein CheW [Peribacillus deserti]|uniref:Purine-binding chemotaxis protein CheW n=1 Tax=Peribacillus deserti TaxID=673318 RepID=A0ABS2QI93_9BACI|nr:chemotaxis protein CheW [Peribacillus deserti]MBM7692243.1 purine-binding chemotaxis protein CheW [Peribacillus deserti]
MADSAALSTASELKVIIFQLIDKEYALPVSEVRSIEKLQHITRVPKTPGFVKGVLNLRGVVTPIIDLRLRFGLEQQTYSESTRIIIAAAQDIEVGLIVDAANDVLDIQADSIEPQPEVAGSIDEEYIEGVVKIDKRLLILLNLEKVLNPEELNGLPGREG